MSSETSETSSLKADEGDREEIEELCKMYDKKMKESEEERKTIEYENKEMLNDLKTKCDAENVAIEELLNVKDMIKMVSDLEVDRFKKDEEINKLSAEIKTSHSNLASITEQLKTANDKIETFENTVDRLVEGNQEKNTQISEAEKMNLKLKNELQIKSGEIDKLMKDHELNVKKYQTEVNSLKSCCSDLKKAKHQVDERLENLYATFKKEKQNRVDKSLELERKNSNLEKAYKEKEQLTDKLLKEIKAVKRRGSSCDSLKVDSRSSENIVDLQNQEEIQINENLKKEIDRLKAQSTNPSSNEQLLKTKIDQLEVSTSKIIQDLKTKNAKFEKENNLLNSKNQAAVKKEALLKEQLLKLQETPGKLSRSDSCESLVKKTTAVSKFEKKYGDLEKLYKEKVAEVEKMKKETTKSKSTARRLQVLTVAAKLKAKPAGTSKTASNENIAKVVQKIAASTENIAKTVTNEERISELDKQVNADKLVVQKLTKELEERKQRLVELESEARLIQQKHAKEMKDLKANLSKRIAENEEYEDLTNQTIHSLNLKCEGLEANIQQDELKFVTNVQQIELLRKQTSEIEGKCKLRIAELEKKNELLLVELETTRQALINSQENNVKLTELQAGTLASNDEKVEKLNEQIIFLQTQNTKDQDEIKTLKSNIKLNEENQAKQIQEAEEKLNEQEKKHFDEIAELNNELEEKLTSLQNELNEKMNEATNAHQTQYEGTDFIRKVYEKRLESISSNDFLANDSCELQQLKRNLNEAETQLKMKETLLKNIQIQLDYQIQVSELMMQSVQKELAKQTGNGEILHILLNLSEQFNQFFKVGKDSNMGINELSVCDSIGESCNLSKFIKPASRTESCYNTKLEVEKLQRQVDVKLNIYSQRFQPILRLDEICQPGESANSPPPFNNNSRLAQTFSANKHRHSQSFSDSNPRHIGYPAQFFDPDQSFNDSGYVDDTNKNETVEYLLRKIHEHVYILKSEDRSNIPIDWFQKVESWEERTTIELNKWTHSQQGRSRSGSIVYRPTNAEVNSIIKNINEQFANSNFN